MVAMTKVIIVGAKGRMGQALLELAQPEAGYELGGAIDLDDVLLDCIEPSDAVIEFAYHAITPQTAEICAQHGKPLVIGTTGHTPEEREKILSYTKDIPIVWASNFSVVVNTLFYLTRKAARILGPDYDQEVVELHHHFKIDAPSGTAVTLGKILAESQGEDYEVISRHGREGEVGSRPKKEVGMHAVRGGDAVGEHTVYFIGDGERLELIHRSSHRSSYASGALRSAAWAVDKAPGLYTMEDVLGLADA